MKIIYVSVFLTLLIESVWAQMSVSTNEFTGTINANMPLWNAQSRELSHRIGISYYSNGVKVDAPSSRVGIGWSLVAGGHIYRTLKGLPDEYVGAGDDTRSGWLVNNNSEAVGSFVTTSDNDYSDCSDERDDWNTLHALSDQNDVDTEPDIFAISVPGISTKFAFDNRGRPATFPFMDLRINYTIDSATNDIVGFVIEDTGGITYYFGQPEKSQLGKTSASQNGSPIYFPRNLKQAKGMFVNSIWHLLSIKSANGDEIIFEYDNTELTKAQVFQRHFNYVIEQGVLNQEHTLHFMDSLILGSREQTSYFSYSPGETNEYKSIDQYIQFSAITYGQPHPVRKITTQKEIVEFHNGAMTIPAGDYSLTKSLLNAVSIYKRQNGSKSLLKTYVLNHSIVKSLKQTGDVEPSHIFLKSISEEYIESDLASNSYSFVYEGVDLEQKQSVLPLRDSNYSDLFGYINSNYSIPSAQTNGSDELFETFIYPDLNSADRIRYYPLPDYSGTVIRLPGKTNDVDVSSVSSGMLRKIHHPFKAETTIVYEPNTYYDEAAGADFYGGGVRVKKLITFDGISHESDLVKAYKYTDNNGHSSGRLSYMPSYATFLNYHIDPDSYDTLHYDQMIAKGLSEDEVWKHRILRSVKDFNTDNGFGGSNINYSQVTGRQTGAGYVVTQYAMGPGYAESTYDNGNWEATSIQVARFVPTSGLAECTDLGVFNQSYGWPFAPNPNFRKGIGYPTKSQVYNESNQLVKEVETHYTTRNYVNHNEAANTVLDSKIKALRFEFTPYRYTINNEILDSTAIVYSLYELNVGTALLPQKTITRDFLLGNLSQPIVTEKEFNYESSAHPFLTETNTTNSDSTSYSTTYLYPKDLVIIGDWNDQASHVKAISTLVNQRILGVPLEVTNKKTHAGGVEEVIGSSLTLFKYDQRGYVVKDQSLSLRIGDGITDFNNLTVTNTDTSDLNYDNRYQMVSYLEDYDNQAVPHSKGTYKGALSGAHLIFDMHLSKLNISNARATQAIFSDFEPGITGHEFKAIGLTTTDSDSHHGENSITMSLDNNVHLEGEVKHLYTDRYQLTCWVNMEANIEQESGNIMLKVMDGTNTQIFTLTPDYFTDWKFYKFPVDLTGFGENISVELSAASALLSLDEVAFYPENASISYNYYDTKGRPVVSMNDNGISGYVEYDDIGRVKYTRDNDRNILRHMTYPNDFEGDPLDIRIIYETVYSNATTTFTVLPKYPQNTTFYWRHVPLADLYANFDPENLDFSGVSSTTENTFSLNLGTVTSTHGDVIQVKAVNGGTERTTFIILDSRDFVLKEVAKLCLSGVRKYDLCTGMAVLTAVCGNETPSQTSFTLSPELTDGSGSYLYTWTRKPYANGNITLQQLGLQVTHQSTNVSTLTYNIGEIQDTYMYRCEVEDQVTGFVYPTDWVSVAVFKSDPNCAAVSGN